MEKLAQTDYPILEILRRRWSPRAFSNQMVEPEKLRSLFEAARWAPSSFNEQPWSFILATKRYPEEHARVLSCLSERNQQWARLAPVLLVSVAKLSFHKTGKPNRHAFYAELGPRSRKPIQSFVFQGQWGQPSPLVSR